MDGASREVLAARQALQRALADIERRLAADPSWHALRQLDDPSDDLSLNGERHFSTADGPPQLWSQLTAQIDQNVPEWRLLTGIKASIAALDAALEADADARDGKPQALTNSGPPSVPSPLHTPTKAVPAPTTRGRSSGRPTDQSSLVARIQSASESWNETPRGKGRSKGRSGAAAPTQPKSAGKRQRREDEAARGNQPSQPSRPKAGTQDHADISRMTALETDVERLLRGDLAHRGALADVHAGSRNSRSQSVDTRGSRLPTIEEAEVEIIQLASPKASHEEGPATHAPRPQPIEPAAATAAKTGDPAVSRQSHFEEATVEIVLLDADRDSADAPDRD